MFALLGATMVALVLSATAAAAQYEPGSSITVDDPNPSVGDSIVVSGTGCEPNSEIEILLSQNPDAVFTTVTDGEGNFSATITIPGNFSPGPATITACGVSITVNIAGVAAPAVTLPRTGGESLPLAQVAVALLAVGGFFVLAARKRAAQVTVDA